MRIEKYFYGVCALCLLLSCQQVAKQVDAPVLPTKPFEMGVYMFGCCVSIIIATTCKSK